MEKVLPSMVGRTLDSRWNVIRWIGHGGMASVYEAEDTTTGRSVAVKILHPRFLSDERVVRRFIREARLANSVAHPRVVRIEHVGTDRANPFLVLELLEGRNLETLLREGGRLPPRQALTLIEQTLEVIVVAHGQGILHRDLTPANLFLDQLGELRVLDFGVASLPVGTNTTGCTSEGCLLGTPAFMSPEQARADWERVDERSDIWSLGATLFSLLTGRDVHQGRTANEILGYAMTRPAPSLASVLCEMPAGIVQIVDKALQFEPRKRWASAADMRQAITQLLASQSLDLPLSGTNTESGVRTLVCSDSTGSLRPVKLLRCRRRRWKHALLWGTPAMLIALSAWGVARERGEASVPAVVDDRSLVIGVPEHASKGLVAEIQHDNVPSASAASVGTAILVRAETAPIAASSTGLVSPRTSANARRPIYSDPLDLRH